jgi:hypothetical protein
MSVRNAPSGRRWVDVRLPILILPATRRPKAPDYVEARRIDERDANREPIELDGRGRIIHDFEARRNRWRQRCRLSRIITMTKPICGFGEHRTLRDSRQPVVDAQATILAAPHSGRHRAAAALDVSGDPARGGSSSGRTGVPAVGGVLAWHEHRAPNEQTCVAPADVDGEVVDQPAGMDALWFRGSRAARSVDLRGKSASLLAVRG